VGGLLSRPIGHTYLGQPKLAAQLSARFRGILVSRLYVALVMRQFLDHSVKAIYIMRNNRHLLECDF
jgi:hypothetical protein